VFPMTRLVRSGERTTPENRLSNAFGGWEVRLTGVEGSGTKKRSLDLGLLFFDVRRAIRRPAVAGAGSLEGGHQPTMTGMTNIKMSSPSSSDSVGRMIPARLGALISREISGELRLFSMSIKNLELKAISMSSPW